MARRGSPARAGDCIVMTNQCATSTRKAVGSSSTSTGVEIFARTWTITGVCGRGETRPYPLQTRLRVTAMTIGIWILGAVLIHVNDIAAQETVVIPPSSEPQNLIVLKNVVVFSADDGLHGRHVWVYNGESGETRVVSEESNEQGRSHRPFAVIQDTLYCIQEGSPHGINLAGFDTALTRSMDPQSLGHVDDRQQVIVEGQGSNRIFFRRKTMSMA